MRHRRSVPALVLQTVAAIVCTHVWRSPRGFVSAQSLERAGRCLLNKSDRSVLAEARAQGMNAITLVVASASGSNANVAQAVEALGGSVVYRDDSVDYQRVVVPLDRVDDVARLGWIDAVNLDATHNRTLSFPPNAALQDPGVGERADVAPPDRHTPRANPYLPTKDIGAPQFVAAHPTFDGRGVTIGIIDHGADVLLPELQTATTIEGRPTRKIVDWLTITDPLNETLPLTSAVTGRAVDRTWVEMHGPVAVASGRLVYEGVSYTVPGGGPYRIGLFDERDPNSIVHDPPLMGDVNRDGNPPGASGLFGVLWDEVAGTVWVDTNQNHSFVDELAMKDYGVRFDVGVFGKDDPGTPLRESVPFVVRTDRRNKYVNLGITYGTHGNMVVGTAVGRDFFGGAFDGVAPGAQAVVLNMADNYYFHSHVEALITAVRHPKVDIVSVAMGVGTALNDGRLVWDVVLDRLVDRYQKPIFVSAANSGPGLNTVQEPSAARKAISVGAYIGRETFAANYGLPVSRTHYLAYYSARGPGEDGGLKPDIVAPTAAMTTDSPITRSENRFGTYPLPPGYRVGGGTSQATPFASGAAALLLSAAKQAGIPIDPERLRRAIATGADFLPGYAAHDQGNGLLHVGNAWDALQRMRAPSVAIASTAPVRTVLADLLETPRRGAGIYEREGWTAGQMETRAITLTRSSGAPDQKSYALRWTGNDGTFASIDSISLPLNVPVDVPVSIHAATVGAHSAILSVIDGSTSTVVHQVLNTVVAAEQLAESTGFTATHKGRVERPGTVSYFFHVPPGSAAFKVDVDISDGTLAVRLHAPSGREVDGFPVSGTTDYQEGGAWSRTLESPAAGVWEVIVENAADFRRRDRWAASPLRPAIYSITATALRVDVEPIKSAVGRDGQAVTFSNRYGAFKGKATGSPLGSAFVTRSLVTNTSSQKLYEIDVPPGSSELTVRIADASDPRADIDLYVFDCTARCRLASYSANPGSSETITISNPKAGSWKAVVDGHTLPGGHASVDYVDVFTHPLYGRLDVTDAIADRPTGATGRAVVAARIDAIPQSTDRSLVGFVDITDQSAYRVESRRKPTASYGVVVGGFDVTKFPAALGRLLVRVAP